MKQTFVIFGLYLAALSCHLCAEDDLFRLAAVRAIQISAPSIGVDQVNLLAIPKLKAPLQGIRLTNASFDPALRGWKLGLRCDPTTACIPSIAFISSEDRHLFPSTATRKQTIVRAGTRKELTLRTNSMSLRVSVTCLQSGGVGDLIRVREFQGKRIFLAVVQPDSTLIMRRPQ